MTLFRKALTLLFVTLPLLGSLSTLKPLNALDPLEAQKPVTIYISYDGEALLEEDVCSDLFRFQREFQKDFPGSKVYHSILPKTVMTIEFDLRLFRRLFNSTPKENREIIRKYDRKIEEMFPRLERSTNFEDEPPEITLTMPQCESSKEIMRQVPKISIEHKEQRLPLARFSTIRLRSEEPPEPYQKYQIELKIFPDNPPPESEIRKYLKRMKTLDRYSHEIKVLR